MSALLRAVRQQRGMTLEELAEATGLTKSYLSKVERQRSTPSIAVAMKLARALGSMSHNCFPRTRRSPRCRSTARASAATVAIKPWRRGCSVSRCRRSSCDRPSSSPNIRIQSTPDRSWCSSTRAWSSCGTRTI